MHTPHHTVLLAPFEKTWSRHVGPLASHACKYDCVLFDSRRALPCGDATLGDHRSALRKRRGLLTRVVVQLIQLTLLGAPFPTALLRHMLFDTGILPCMLHNKEICLHGRLSPAC